MGGWKCWKKVVKGGDQTCHASAGLGGFGATSKQALREGRMGGPGHPVQGLREGTTGPKGLL